MKQKSIFLVAFLILLNLTFTSCSSNWSTPGPNRLVLVNNKNQHMPYRQFTHGATYDVDGNFLSASGELYLSRLRYDFDHFLSLPIIIPSNDIHIFVDGPGIAVSGYVIVKITDPLVEYEEFNILISNSINLEAPSNKTINIEMPSESGEYLLIFSVWYSNFGRTYRGRYQKPFTSMDYVFRLAIN